ncbi:MAG: hypothetical protein P8Z73_03525 [Desulfobacteraceae bacterium]
MAVFSILMSTSLMPISGTGTRSSHKPDSGLDLTSACIIFVMDGLLWTSRGR